MHNYRRRVFILFVMYQTVTDPSKARGTNNLEQRNRRMLKVIMKALIAMDDKQKQQGEVIEEINSKIDKIAKQAVGYKSATLAKGKFCKIKQFNGTICNQNFIPKIELNIIK